MSSHNNAIVKILSLLADGPKKRSYVTSELRNFKIEIRHKAIRHVVDDGLVSFADDNRKGKGRQAVIVSLTDKGREHLKIYKPIHADTIWGC